MFRLTIVIEKPYVKIAPTMPFNVSTSSPRKRALHEHLSVVVVPIQVLGVPRVSYGLVCGQDLGVQ